MINGEACVVATAELTIIPPGRIEGPYLRILRIEARIDHKDCCQKNYLHDWQAHHALNKECYCLEFCGRLKELLVWEASACCACGFKSGGYESPPPELVAIRAEWGLRPQMRLACSSGIFRPQAIDPLVLVDLRDYSPEGFSHKGQGRENDDGRFTLSAAGLFPDDKDRAELVMIKKGIRLPQAMKPKRKIMAVKRRRNQ